MCPQKVHIYVVKQPSFNSLFKIQHFHASLCLSQDDALPVSDSVQALMQVVKETNIS